MAAAAEPKRGLNRFGLPTGEFAIGLQAIIAFVILAVTIGLFLWGRWRYDLVAVFSLLAVVASGLVPAADAFSGFGNPAVITVAAVLVISRGLLNAGLVDAVVRMIAPLRGRENLQLAAQCIVIALLSSFMNNVGALALMLPVALRNAYRDGYPPGKTLMPLAFASLLGGLVTLIGTPPNIIVSGFRERVVGAPFGMFDYSPVGLALAAAGLAFLILVGWRLIPINPAKGEAGKAFAIENYIFEAEVQPDSRAEGITVAELESLAEEDLLVLGIIRDGVRRLVPAGRTRVFAGDVLVLRGDTDALGSIISEAGLKLLGDDNDRGREDIRSEDVEIVEAVVGARSSLVGTSPRSARLRTVHGVNLLGIARQGRRLADRIEKVRFRPGDVLLLQGPSADMADTLNRLGCLPLAERPIGLQRQRRLALAGGLFAAGLALVVSGLAPVEIAFVAVAGAFVVTGIIKPAELYTAIEWPVIVLLGALFPVGMALETSGATGYIADAVVGSTGGLDVWVVLLILFVVTMFVSDIVNNNATALLMAPVALTVAERLSARPDAFLMAVAIGASCAFLSPIGHQSNTLVMEPGGYRFGDYWRVGLPLQVVLIVVAIPMILIVWPI